MSTLAPPLGYNPGLGPGGQPFVLEPMPWRVFQGLGSESQQLPAHVQGLLSAAGAPDGDDDGDDSSESSDDPEDERTLFHPGQ